MIQLIGFMIATYTICRLLQISIQMCGGSPKWEGMPLFGRFILVSLISAVGVLILVVLSIMMLMQSQQLRHMNGF